MIIKASRQHLMDYEMIFAIVDTDGRCDEAQRALFHRVQQTDLTGSDESKSKINERNNV